MLSILLIMLLCLLPYAAVGLKLTPFFTKYAFDWLNTKAGLAEGKPRSGVYNVSRDRDTIAKHKEQAVVHGNIYAVMWPWMLVRAKQQIGVGKAGAPPKGVNTFERRLAKLEPKKALEAQNKARAQALGLETDEYE